MADVPTQRETDYTLGVYNFLTGLIYLYRREERAVVVAAGVTIGTIMGAIALVTSSTQTRGGRELVLLLLFAAVWIIVGLSIVEATALVRIRRASEWIKNNFEGKDQDFLKKFEEEPGENLENRIAKMFQSSIGVPALLLISGVLAFLGLLKLRGDYGVLSSRWFVFGSIVGVLILMAIDGWAIVYTWTFENRTAEGGAGHGKN